jgi:hypothetical protein
MQPNQNDTNSNAKPLKVGHTRKKSKGKKGGGRPARSQTPKETVLVSNFMLPGPADQTPGVVVLYNIHAIMANREKAELTGDLRQDLKPGEEWGVAEGMDPDKVERWVKAGRLVRRQLIVKRSGKKIFRNTYAEPAEWMAVFSEEEQAWLNACIEVHQLQAAEQNAKRTLATIFGQVAEAAKMAQAQPAKEAKKAAGKGSKGRKLSRKARRQAEKARSQLEEGT